MKPADKQMIALASWVIFCIGEFVILPQFFGIGLGVAGLPADLKNMRYPGLWIWWSAVKGGLPIWLLVSGICFWIILSNRE